MRAVLKELVAELDAEPFNTFLDPGPGIPKFGKTDPRKGQSG
jgi:hypothetical protein